MARKLEISFKETKKDLELYYFLSELEDRSTEVKNALRKYMMQQEVKNVDYSSQKFNNKIDITNF